MELQKEFGSQRLTSLLDTIRRELCYQEADIFTEDDLSVLIAHCFDNDSKKLINFAKISILDALQSKGLTEYLTFDISPILDSERYLSRIQDMILKRYQSQDPSAPYLRISPYPMTNQQIDKQLGDRPNLALIFEAESIYFQDTLHGLQNDALWENEFSPVNVLGVHYHWLRDNGTKTQRALVLDEKGYVKDTLFERNISFRAVQILHIPYKREMELHREISSLCHKNDIFQINPWDVSHHRADNKFMSYNLWRDSIITPKSCLIVKSTSCSELKKILEKFAHELSQRNVIVLPNQGTEGHLVQLCDLYDMDTMINYIFEYILPVDDCLVREMRGNIFYMVQGTAMPEYRPISFRINVGWDGKEFSAESAFAQISNAQNNPVTSLSQGGKIISFTEGLSNLYHLKPNKEGNLSWKKYSVTEKDLARIKNAACKAMSLINRGLDKPDYLKFAGIDLLLEIEGKYSKNDNVIPVILEINPRPAGLAQSRELTINNFSKLKISESMFRYIQNTISHV